MNQTQLLVVIVVIAVIAVAGILFFARKRRSQKLRERFGPEYDRVVKQEEILASQKGYWNFASNAERSSKPAHCRPPPDPVLRFLGKKSKAGL